MNTELARIIEQSSSEDLNEAQHMINTLLETQRNKAKEEAWRKLTNAIKDYVTAFGYIEVDTDSDIFYMSNIDDYSSIGEIQIK